MPPAEDAEPISVSLLAKVAIFVCAALIIVLGIYPLPLLHLIP